MAAVSVALPAIVHPGNVASVNGVLIDSAIADENMPNDASATAKRFRARPLLSALALKMSSLALKIKLFIITPNDVNFH